MMLELHIIMPDNEKHKDGKELEEGSSGFSCSGIKPCKGLGENITRKEKNKWKSHGQN